MARILVVDDEPVVVEFLSDAFRDAGYEVDGAPEGVSAVLRVLDGRCDAVLMDVRMPKLDGIGALRIIRRIAPKLPVIMITGQAGQGDMAESVRLGAVGCLLKPFHIEEALRTLKVARVEPASVLANPPAREIR